MIAGPRISELIDSRLGRLDMHSGQLVLGKKTDRQNSGAVGLPARRATSPPGGDPGESPRRAWRLTPNLPHPPRRQAESLQRPQPAAERRGPAGEEDPKGTKGVIERVKEKRAAEGKMLLRERNTPHALRRAFASLCFFAGRDLRWGMGSGLEVRQLAHRLLAPDVRLVGDPGRVELVGVGHRRQQGEPKPMGRAEQCVAARAASADRDAFGRWRAAADAAGLAIDAWAALLLELDLVLDDLAALPDPESLRRDSSMATAASLVLSTRQTLPVAPLVGTAGRLQRRGGRLAVRQLRPRRYRAHRLPRRPAQARRTHPSAARHGGPPQSRLVSWNITASSRGARRSRWCACAAEPFSSSGSWSLSQARYMAA